MQAVTTYAHMQNVPAHVELIQARPVLIAFHERLCLTLFEPDEESCWRGAWDPKKNA